jgi:aryl-alcohol dehydrogenase-like predicted oxidoreductase
MQRRLVGRCGLQVSRLGLGTLSWGRDVLLADARALLRRFVAEGGSLVDTAAAYGNGDAERIIGHLLRTDVRRDEVVIATKAGFGIRDGRRVVDTSRQALLADLRGSLRRLRTDHIDIWQLHAWGSAPLEESLAAIDQAVSAGDVRYAGISNFVGWQTAQAVTWQAAFPGRAPIAAAQVEYSLLARRAEVEVIPAIRAFGLGFFPWSPLGRGVLTGKYRGGTPRGSRGAASHFSWFVEPYLEARSGSVVDAVTVAAAGLDLSPAQVALLWVRDAPAVTAPLLGARTVEQLDPLLALDEVELPAEIVAALDDVSGGPNAGREPEPED